MENAKEFIKRLRKNLETLKGKRSNTEMGDIIKASYVTFGRRLSDPQELTLKEVFLLCKWADVPMERFITEELKIQ